MKHALIIDIQNTNEGSFLGGDRRAHLRRILDGNIPVHVALTPYQRSQWQDLEDDIGKVVTREGSGLLLEGLLHVCTQRNHTIRDPHHQSICTSLFQRNASYAQQLDEIGKGLGFLEKIFGNLPVKGYVPPQHLWNTNTLRAVDFAGLTYMVTNAMFSHMNPYKRRNVVVVPSGSVKKGRTNNPVLHVYYDRIKDGFLDETGEIVPLSEIPVVERSFMHDSNGAYLWMEKQARDARRLVRWLNDEEFRKKPDANAIKKGRQEEYEKHARELYN